MNSIRMPVRILVAVAAALLFAFYLYNRSIHPSLVTAEATAISPGLPALTASIPDGAGGPPSLAPIIERVTDAVVNVAVKSNADTTAGGNPAIPGNMLPGEHMAEGSGVIVDAVKGYILTNFHVVDNATDIVITLKDQREFTARIMGSDKGTDIALLQIDATDLRSLPMGHSSVMRVGDYVVAVGNPFGLGQTVTFGIVSALGRSGLNIEDNEDFIQTDASINPGNSGGALVNMSGELIGINTAIVGPNGGNVGIGFAIPTSMARGVMNELLKFGKVTRGYVGVEVQNLTPDVAGSLGISQSLGALVTAVDKESAAATGGLKTGDVVIGLNALPIRNGATLRNRMGLLPAGTAVDLTIMRNNLKMDIKITIGNAPAEEATTTQAQHPMLDGASFANGKTSNGVKGVRVTSVAQESPAWQVGLRSNDVIVSVNRVAINGGDELEAALKGPARRPVLFIDRDGQEILIIL